MPELLLSVRNLTKAFGGPPLFDGLTFGICDGDHVGLVGPNGSGKSTLLRLLAGIEPLDAGELAARRGLRVGYVPQTPTFDSEATVDSVLRAALAATGTEPETVEGRLAFWMGQSGLAEGRTRVEELSGGWRKRLAIVSELVPEPDLLLLDEPTNHLDVDGILWLEETLRRELRAFLAVSHDRYFLESVAARMIELNPAFASGLLLVEGRYSDYLRRKDETLASQAAYQESLRNRVRGEMAWLARKARARSRKAQARIDAAGRLVEELEDLDARSSSDVARIRFAGTERKTRRLLVAQGAGRRFDDRWVVRGLDLVLSPGTRLGLLGSNGSGKTTLLRMLAQLDRPDEGTVEWAPHLRVVIFDQHRTLVEPGTTLRRALAPTGDTVVHSGQPVHVAGWAKRFLFHADQLEMPVERLSGGEQARVFIARLMLQPADVLLLDEPTNDLDIPTLEVLEESLLAFPGALVLVTHDRYLLDRVATRILALDGEAQVLPFADLAQWEAQRANARSSPASPPARCRGTDERPPSHKPRRLGYLDQREWDSMEPRILEAEEALAACELAAADPAIASDHVALTERSAALEAARAKVERLYARWAELEAKLP
jgi:ATP-binding cassette subfamily F protein uup